MIRRRKNLDLFKPAGEKHKPRRAELLRATSAELLENRRLLTAWYVSTTGNAANPGTLNQPFNTIQEAANVAQPGDVVFIMGGVYHETVTPANSGLPGEPITYEPYNGQSVTIDGADPITGWSQYQNSIYSTAMPWDLGEGNNQLFVDGNMVNEARWPNTPVDVANPTSTAPANITTPSWSTMTSVSVQESLHSPSTLTIYNSSLNQPAGTWVGSVAHFLAGQAWVDQTGIVTASSPGSVTVSYYQETAYQVPAAGNKFYLVGAFQSLDSAGEWYRDPASGRVYLWDPGSDNPVQHTIEAKARDYGFDLSGASNIDISNISLFACTINTDANSSNNVLNGISAQYVSQSIGITAFTQDPWSAQFSPHTTGIILNGTGNILENSTVAFSSGDGVFVGGSNNTVENTVIHDVDYEGGDEAGITTLGSNEIIRGNTIYNVARSGIVCRYTYDSLITHNLIDSVALQTTDCGGIYTWGTNGLATEISYNVVYNAHSGGYGAAGVYLDNYSQAFTVDHNLAFNCDIALKLNPPSVNNVIVCNTFVGTQYALQSSGAETMTITRLQDNIFSGATMFGPGAILNNNITSPTNPLFVNTSAKNYQLQASSPAINSGAPELPFTANYVGSAPDAGAYEYGLVPFRAGASAMQFVPPTPSSPTTTPLPVIPLVNWSVPADITSGTPLSTTQLNAWCTIPGTFVYTPALGTILPVGAAQTLSVTFTPLNTVDYVTATKSVSLNVDPGSPPINWPTPASIVYGTALGAAQLDATNTIPGQFTYSPAAGTILGAGAQTLSVTFTPTDTVDYTAETSTVTLNVLQATPTVTWATPLPINFGTALSAMQLGASSSIPGSFTYSVGPGTILGAGMQTLSATFNPTDSVDYATVMTSVVLQVNQDLPVLNWANPAAIVYGTALSATQLDATNSLSGTFSYTPAAGTVLGAGAGQTLSVTFTPTDSVDYMTASASVTLDVDQATPAVTWNVPPTMTAGTALGPAQLDASSLVPGTFNYTPATGTVLNVGAGQPISVIFTPTDTTDYSSVTINRTIDATNTPVISWTPPTDITYGTALTATQLDATSSVPGTFNYTPALGTVLSVGNAQSLSVSFTPDDTVDYTSASGSTTINVDQATPTINWPTPASITYGTPLTSTQLAASANVPGTFVYNNAIGTILPAGTTTLTATFQPTDSTDYSAAGANTSLLVTPAGTSTIVSSNNSSPYVSQAVTFTAKVTPTTGSNPTGTVQFTIDGASVGMTNVGANGIASYTTSIATAGDHVIGATYSGEQNFSGSVSAAFTQTVVLPTAPVVTTQPASQTAATGSTATFSAAATGQPTPSVQWQLSTNSGSTWANISGATSTSYAFTAATGQSGYQYRAMFANAGGSTASKSATLTLQASPARLVFLKQPTTMVAGANIAPIEIAVEDANGNILTGQVWTVTLQVASGPSGVKLSGTISANTVNGIATFSAASIKTAGNYTVKAAEGTLTSAASQTFTITPGAANQLIIISQPTTGNAGSKLATSLVVYIEDANYNRVTSDSSTVSLSLYSGTANTLAGVLTAKAVNGIATFSGVILSKSGSYRLKLTDGSLKYAITQTIVIS